MKSSMPKAPRAPKIPKIPKPPKAPKTKRENVPKKNPGEKKKIGRPRKNPPYNPSLEALQASRHLEAEMNRSWMGEEEPFKPMRQPKIYSIIPNISIEPIKPPKEHVSSKGRFSLKNLAIPPPTNRSTYAKNLTFDPKPPSPLGFRAPPSKPLFPPNTPNIPKSLRNLKRSEPLTELRSNRLKDLGRWKATDDYALLINMRQCPDFRTVFTGVEFSCYFNIPELQARWNLLMFDKPISTLAAMRLKALHPETVLNIKRKALYNKHEEKALNVYKSTDFPTLEDFQKLLDEKADIFLDVRTAKDLQKYWHAMKNFELLSDQRIKPNTFINFAELEVNMNPAVRRDPKNTALNRERKIFNRKRRAQIRALETELTNLKTALDAMGLGYIFPELDGDTFALLRGKNVEFLLLSENVMFGRSAPDMPIDVDLNLECPNYKISRLQGMIELKDYGQFFITNLGKREIFVNGDPVFDGDELVLPHNCILDICGLNFVFVVNHEKVKAWQKTRPVPSPVKITPVPKVEKKIPTSNEKTQHKVKENVKNN